MSCTWVSPSGLGAVISSATSLAASSNYIKDLNTTRINRKNVLIILPKVNCQRAAFEVCVPAFHQSLKCLQSRLPKNTGQDCTVV